MTTYHRRALVIPLFGAQAVTETTSQPQQIAKGVWFFVGDKSKGYSNTTVIEMEDYLIVVDANYPGRAKELVQIVKGLSPKPVRYVFDTHAHGDHSYGNAVWTASGATTLAFQGVALDMDKWEPTRWRQAMPKRADLRETGQNDVQRPQKLIYGHKLVLKDKMRDVEFLAFGWGHTEGDGYVWLPRERILCTGDGAVNGPYNKVIDANLTNWPKALDRVAHLRPLHVLPGHGKAGDAEILTGQAQFFRDLRRAVADDIAKGQKPPAMTVELPAADRNWVPISRPDLWQQDIATMYLELVSHKPAGSLPHEWK
ncbi:MBL fold metallo-hydrolase [Granulicella sp. 5B5]|nr:MBL fold metallo-hydrolase [Granulicella sp. 5B5]